MALPTQAQPSVGFAPQSQHIAVNIQINSPPASVAVDPKHSTGSRSFFGRMVETISHSERYQKLADRINRSTRALSEMAIDIGHAMKILGKETWKGVSYGALAGLGAGGVITALCPPLVGTAFTASISAGVTAGGLIGSQIGLDKAIGHFNAARKARKAQAEAELIEQQRRDVVNNPFSEQAQAV